MQEGSVVTAAASAPVSETETGGRGFLARAFDRWKKAAHAIGVVQTRFLMLLVYAFCVIPTGLLMRLSGDPLRLKRPETTNWTPIEPKTPSLDSARQQF
jgi:hypothetical protein